MGLLLPSKLRDYPRLLPTHMFREALLPPSRTQSVQQVHALQFEHNIGLNSTTAFIGSNEVSRTRSFQDFLNINKHVDVVVVMAVLTLNLDALMDVLYRSAMDVADTTTVSDGRKSKLR